MNTHLKQHLKFLKRRDEGRHNVYRLIFQPQWTASLFYPTNVHRYIDCLTGNYANRSIQQSINQRLSFLWDRNCLSDFTSRVSDRTEFLTGMTNVDLKSIAGTSLARRSSFLKPNFNIIHYFKPQALVNKTLFRLTKILI